MQQTEQELLADHIQKMGPELGELFHALSGELQWLHWRWNEFRALFGEKPSRIELMNDSAPLFFQVVHDTLFEITLLGVARFVSPPKSVGKLNLTIQRFCEPSLFILRPSLSLEISGFVATAIDASRFAVEWRNRHIAHRDLGLALKRNVKPLPKTTREMVEKALSALRDVLNQIEQRYCDSTTAYSFSVSPWGAENLLTVIRDGLLREQDRRARWDREEVQEDDMKPLPPI